MKTGHGLGRRQGHGHGLDKDEDGEAKAGAGAETLTRQVARGGGITLAGTAFGRLVQLGLYILLGRALGAGAYGLYILGLSIVQLASQVALLGLPNGLVRFVALYRGEGDLGRVKGTLVAAFFIATSASFIVGGALFGASGPIAIRIFAEPRLGAVLRALAVALPFLAIVQLSAHSARGFQRMGYYVGVQSIIWPVLNLGLVGLFFLLGLRLAGALGGFLLSVIISALLGLYFLTRRLFPEGTSVQATYETKKLLRFSIPVVLIGFGGLILAQTDRLMIGYFLSSQDVGIYDAAGRVALQISFVISSFNMAFAPMIAELYNKNRGAELGALFQRVTRWIVTLTLPLFLMLALFPDTVMRLFGGEFVRGAGALVALATAHLINAATGAVGFMLIMSGKQDIELVNILTLGAVNIGLNIWLIPLHGILGAAVATGLSLALINIIRLAEVYKLIGVQPFSGKWRKPLIAAAGTFLLIMLYRSWLYRSWGGIHDTGAVPWTGLLALGLCPLLYLLGLVLLRLEAEDVALLRALRHKFVSLVR